MQLSQRAELYLKSLELIPQQYEAACERARDVAVTAGAGSGKTRTLVARYLSLLADGLAPDALVAITFTEKAAREMRARVRKEIRGLVVKNDSPNERSFWQALERRMDAARIGTIHALCAEMLRAHPAEAAIDPQFQVLEEGLAAIARADAVDAALAAAVLDPSMNPLLRAFSSRNLSILLTQMLNKRLDVQDWLETDFQIQTLITAQLRNFFENQQILSIEADLACMDTAAISQDTTEKGVEQILAFRSGCTLLHSVFLSEDAFATCQQLQILRTTTLGRLVGGKNSRTKEMLQEWRDTYDQCFAWLGKTTIQPDVEIEINAILPLIQQCFRTAQQNYHQILKNQQALDFDDLERGAVQLLALTHIRTHWQNQVQALLVDEFQDTNQRQRSIVEALTDAQPGKLFIVGDARQSIYRFRGADVAVFRSVQADISTRGGLLLDLNLTFRSHPALLSGMGDLLAPIMGIKDDPQRPFQVAFTSLNASRREALAGVQAPYVELLLGAGEDAVKGREISAGLLAARLRSLKENGEIKAWQDVSLLLRASSAFGVYEDALETAGIPYVTVAGSGFYERPEIRDILNLLRALADPWDDLAMVGLLRSPAVGMSDPGITLLRWPDPKSTAISLHLALSRDLSHLSLPDQRAAQRAGELFAALAPLVGRIPVAEVLQRLAGFSLYRAILAAAPQRTWRNLEKLLQDAYASGLYSVHAYLEYLGRVREVGAREGEAPGEAEEAVQLMTIHKSKGLEFPFVVLADAGRMERWRAGRWLLLPGNGAAFKTDQPDYETLLLRLLRQQDQEREAAENKRLLYVALTRAKEKLIVSGHLSPSYGKYHAEGWLKELLSTLDLNAETLPLEPPTQPLHLPCGQTLQIQVTTSQSSLPFQAPPQKTSEIVQPSPWVEAIWEENQQDAPLIERVELTSLLPDPHQPAAQSTTGKLLHSVLQTWHFPEPDEQETLLRAALELGLVDDVPRRTAVEKVQVYLQRLQRHPLYSEISQADQRHHEVPYEVEDEPLNDRGRLDILYHTPQGWKIVDFKTDRLDSLQKLDPERRATYRNQLQRYLQAVQTQLGVTPTAQICFLDVNGRLELMDWQML
jgi:ATP-dependent helicase/nuclease subunit A